MDIPTHGSCFLGLHVRSVRGARPLELRTRRGKTSDHRQACPSAATSSYSCVLLGQSSLSDVLVSCPIRPTNLATATTLRNAMQCWDGMAERNADLGRFSP